MQKENEKIKSEYDETNEILEKELQQEKDLSKTLKLGIDNLESQLNEYRTKVKTQIEEKNEFEVKTVYLPSLFIHMDPLLSLSAGLIAD